MKKTLVFIITLGFIVTLSACTTADLEALNNLAYPETLSSSESLSTLAYLSGSMLNIDSTDSTVGINLFKLSATDETEIETELDTVTMYMDQLQEFMDNGTTSFGSVVQEVSDNPAYAYMVTFMVNGETYLIYYNIDALTLEISGIMLIGDVEYVIEVSNTLSDNETLEEHDNNYEENDADQDIDNEEDSDVNNHQETSDIDGESGATVDSENSTEEPNNTVDPEDDEHDSEIDNEDHDNDIDNEDQEQQMVLTAYNGDDFVKVVYKVETSDEETETKFTLTSSIAGVEREVFMKISIEEDEYKITIEEAGNKYTFKQEVEDGETTYKLKYDVNGVIGEVKIIEKVNDLGEIVYEYQINEGDKSSTVEKVEPNHHSDEHENDDEQESDDDDA